MIVRNTDNLFLMALVPILGALAGCGSSGDCSNDYTFNDPSGQWSGVLARVESDCGSNSKGPQFPFTHYVSVQCDAGTESTIYLYNEQNLEFRQTSSVSGIGGGSFTAQYEGDTTTIDISYDNYDGNLADVTEKIRVYANGRILCSEKYAGQARR